MGYYAGVLCAEDEGRLDVSTVVLVQALGVEEVNVGYGCVGDFDVNILRRF